MSQSPDGSKSPAAEPPFESGDVRFLRFDTGEETHLFPYIGLRHVGASVVDGRTRRERLVLTFDLGTVDVVGKRVMDLLPEIQGERLVVVRAGISEDPALPEIEQVQILMSSKAHETEGE